MGRGSGVARGCVCLSPLTRPRCAPPRAVQVDALVMVQHPGVVKLHAAYYHADKLWMIIDFCSGGVSACTHAAAGPWPPGCRIAAV